MVIILNGCVPVARGGLPDTLGDGCWATSCPFGIAKRRLLAVFVYFEVGAAIKRTGTKFITHPPNPNGSTIM